MIQQLLYFYYSVSYFDYVTVCPALLKKMKEIYTCCYEWQPLYCSGSTAEPKPGWMYSLDRSMPPLYSRICPRCYSYEMRELTSALQQVRLIKMADDINKTYARRANPQLTVHPTARHGRISIAWVAPWERIYRRLQRATPPPPPPLSPLLNRLHFMNSIKKNVN